MTDLLAYGLSWLADQQQSHTSQQVVYRRGNLTVEVLAVIGRAQFEYDDGQPVVVEDEIRDFLIRPAELVLNSQTVLPQRGDQIEWTSGGQTYTHEVAAPGDGPPWRWSDPYRTRLRIHAKVIA